MIPTMNFAWLDAASFGVGLIVGLLVALGIALYAREVVSRIMPEEDGK